MTLGIQKKKNLEKTSKIITSKPRNSNTKYITMINNHFGQEHLLYNIMPPNINTIKYKLISKLKSVHTIEHNSTICSNKI